MKNKYKCLYVFNQQVGEIFLSYNNCYSDIAYKMTSAYINTLTFLFFQQKLNLIIQLRAFVCRDIKQS